MRKDQLTVGYVFTVVLSVLFTWLLHEFAHWLTSEAMGYKAAMTLNSTGYLNERPEGFQEMMVSAAGPLITIGQALLIFLILEFGYWNKQLFPFLLTPFYMRLLAGGMNAINPNDEGRVSLFFDFGLYVLPLVVSGILLLMVFIVIRRHQLRARFILGTVLAIMVASSVLILADQFFRIRIL